MARREPQLDLQSSWLPAIPSPLTHCCKEGRGRLSMTCSPFLCFIWSTLISLYAVEWLLPGPGNFGNRLCQVLRNTTVHHNYRVITIHKQKGRVEVIPVVLKSNFVWGLSFFLFEPTQMAFCSLWWEGGWVFWKLQAWVCLFPGCLLSGGECQLPLHSVCVCMFVCACMHACICVFSWANLRIPVSQFGDSLLNSLVFYLNYLKRKFGWFVLCAVFPNPRCPGHREAGQFREFSVIGMRKKTVIP